MIEIIDRWPIQGNLSPIAIYFEIQQVTESRSEWRNQWEQFYAQMMGWA